MSDRPSHVRGDAALDAVAGLGGPVRRRLYQLVVDSTGPVSRDDAALATGINHSLAGYHLDRLSDDGLLEVTYGRLGGRRGPGAGRPAKLYRPAAVEVTVQLPPRDDTLVAHLLATAVEADSSGAARRALRKATRRAGKALGEELTGQSPAELVAALERRGYAPLSTPEGVRLRNCPFHHLVDDHLDLVCHLNHDLLGALIERSGSSLEAQLDPQPGMCCVVLRPEEPTGKSVQA